MRLMRLSRKAKGVQNLAQTLVVTLPSLMHVSFLLMIFFFMYAVLGVQLFYNVKLQSVLTRHANFSNFGKALYTLFRISSGENWNPLMHEIMIAPPYCTPMEMAVDGIGDCGPPSIVTVIYFLTFTLLCAMTALNLIVAVILFAFFELSEMNNNPEGYVNCLRERHFKEYKEVWMCLDPEGEGLIDNSDLPTLLDKLPNPIGAASSAHAAEMAVTLLHGIQAIRDNKGMSLEDAVVRKCSILRFRCGCGHLRVFFSCNSSFRLMTQPMRVSLVGGGRCSSQSGGRGGRGSGRSCQNWEADRAHPDRLGAIQ